MPRTRVETPEKNTTPTPFVIAETGVYTPAQVQAGLGLRASSLRTEWRKGRLRVRRRCGRNYLLGSDLLEWLRDAELRPRASRHADDPAA